MGRRGLASCAVLVVAGVAVAAQSPQTGAPRQPRTVAVGVADGTLLRSWDATVDSMRRGGELVLSRTRTDTVLAGRTHERYEQYFHGIRIVGGEVTRQLTRGVTSSIFGELHQVSGVPDRPEISEDAAREVFRSMASGEVPDGRPIELVILQKDDGTYTLSVRNARLDDRRVDADLHRCAERRAPAPLQRSQDSVRRGDGNRRARRHEKDQYSASVGPLHCRRCAEASGADYLRHAGEPVAHRKLPGRDLRSDLDRHCERFGQRLDGYRHCRCSRVSRLYLRLLLQTVWPLRPRRSECTYLRDHASSQAQ